MYAEKCTLLLHLTIPSAIGASVGQPCVDSIF